MKEYGWVVFNREPFDRNENPVSFVRTQSLFSRDDGALIRDYMTRPKENESPSSDFHARSSSHLEDPRWFLIHFAYTEMYGNSRSFNHHNTSVDRRLKRDGGGRITIIESFLHFNILSKTFLPARIIKSSRNRKIPNSSNSFGTGKAFSPRKRRIDLAGLFIHKSIPDEIRSTINLPGKARYQSGP